MEGKLIVTSSPHLRSGVTTRQIMLDVLISLAPCVVAATWIFGFRALLVTVFCAAVCVLLEFICRLVMKREQTIGDLSAAVSGGFAGIDAAAVHRTCAGAGRLCGGDSGRKADVRRYRMQLRQPRAYCAYRYAAVVPDTDDDMDACGRYYDRDASWRCRGRS